MNEELTSIANRVRQLERQNLVMRITAILLLGCCVFLIIDSFNSLPLSSTAKQITAEEFVLVDSNGIQRGRWALDASGTSLRFYAPDQGILCTLNANSASGGLYFGSKEGLHFRLTSWKNDFQMFAGVDQGYGPMALTASKFQGGHIGDKTMYKLELRDTEGKTVFNSADYYGFNPQEPKP